MTERDAISTDPTAIAAELGIRDTIARYAHHVDDGDFEALADLFTEDGEFVIDRFDEPVNPMRGRRAIAEYLTHSADARSSDPERGPYRRHHVSSMLVRLESTTTARVESYFTAVMIHGVDHWGRYEDNFEFVGGRWRFAKRHVRVDGRISRV
jgi:3-phenylpropionate/cinnamic acid dioxygenase small subunit